MMEGLVFFSYHLEMHIWRPAWFSYHLVMYVWIPSCWSCMSRSSSELVESIFLLNSIKNKD